MWETTTEKVAFVSGLGGSDVLDVVACITPAHVSIALAACLQYRFAGNHTGSISWTSLACDCVPLLSTVLSVTVLAEHPLVTTAVLLLSCCLVTYSSTSSTLRTESSISSHTAPSRLVFEGTGRASLMLLTCVSILAVDFHAFPRRLAKTETYGISLMDCGVGSFVALNALSSCRHPAASLKRRLRRALPLLVLGGGRFLSVSLSGYHNHVTEYGTHWNFFLTLAAVHTFAGRPFLPPATLVSTPATVATGLAILLGHQALLVNGMAHYVMNAQRNSFFSSNREGFLSLPGYVGLYLAAHGHALLFLPPLARPPSSQTQQHRDLLPTPLPAATFGATTATAAAAWAAGCMIERPCRRTANLAYCLWTLTLHFYSYTLCAILHRLFHPAMDTVLSSASPHQHSLTLVLNRHMLPLFLVANVLTGFVNMSVDTLSFQNATAVGVLLLYAACVFISPVIWSARTELAAQVERPLKQK